MINNNRQQNGRRRGRGGQRQGGGGNQGNGSRIDNRARGNAAQLLEKYKNLASDAQRQGDRVNTEYYLQFADHYFRVVSEQRGRFEEQDRQRREAQGYDPNYDGDDFDGDDNDMRSDGRAEQQPQRDREEREPRRYDNERGGEREGREERGGRERNRDGNREGGREAGREGNREGGRERLRRDRDDNREQTPAEGVAAVEGEPIEASEQAAPRPRRARRTEAAAPVADTFDATRLPPSFAPANDGDDAAPEAEAEAKPRRRRLRPAGEASQAS